MSEVARDTQFDFTINPRLHLSPLDYIGIASVIRAALTRVLYTHCLSLLVRLPMRSFLCVPDAYQRLLWMTRFLLFLQV